MLPHAGWVYCQDIIAKTLGPIEVPDVVIVIGPKHTAHGANWSVSNHCQWEMPSGNVAVDTEVVGKLLDLYPSLKCEPLAHEQEHGVEVLLPWLQAKNPNVRVVPIAMGHSNYEQLEMFGDALGQLIQKMDTPPLLVISSDMNHFGNAQTTEEKDGKALDAMCQGDAKLLFDTCLNHQVSMCGMRPAVAVMNALGKVPIKPSLIARSHSGKVSGDNSRVVGYAGVVIE